MNRLPSIQATMIAVTKATVPEIQLLVAEMIAGKVMTEKGHIRYIIEERTNKSILNFFLYQSEGQGANREDGQRCHQQVDIGIIAHRCTSSSSSASLTQFFVSLCLVQMSVVYRADDGSNGCDDDGQNDDPVLAANSLIKGIVEKPRLPIMEITTTAAMVLSFFDGGMTTARNMP